MDLRKLDDKALAMLERDLRAIQRTGSDADRAVATADLRLVEAEALRRRHGRPRSAWSRAIAGAAARRP